MSKKYDDKIISDFSYFLNYNYKLYLLNYLIIQYIFFLFYR